MPRLVVDRLIEAGRQHGDPLAWEEIARLRLPIARAPDGRRFERWVAHRRQTMRQAVADDAASGQGTDRWAQAWRVLGESPGTPVVMLLLDRRSVHVVGPRRGLPPPAAPAGSGLGTIADP